MSTLKYNTWLNTDNTENYKCRAWVNFNGTGTVAIRASGNVSSITDNGTGRYTINLASSLSDSNHSPALMASPPSSYASGIFTVTGISTSTIVVELIAQSAYYDPTSVYVQTFR